MSTTSDALLSKKIGLPNNDYTSTHEHFTNATNFAMRRMNFKVVGGTTVTYHAAPGDFSTLSTIPSHILASSGAKRITFFSGASGFEMEGSNFVAVGGNCVEFMCEYLPNPSLDEGLQQKDHNQDRKPPHMKTGRASQIPGIPRKCIRVQERMMAIDKWSAEFATSEDHSYLDRNTPATAQDQILLKALQEFMVPLIRTVLDQKSVDKRPLGPESMKLISSLKEFVSSVVLKTTIHVELEDNEDESNTDADDTDTEKEGVVTSLKASKLTEDEIGSDAANMSKASETTFHDKVLRNLRNHVFNKMPIHLLCIKLEDSSPSLEISVLDREGIYKHLEEKMQEIKNENEYRPLVLSARRRGRTILETDEEATMQIVSKYAGYAILSHTWLRGSPGEVTFTDWAKGIFAIDDAGYEKLANFCKIVWKYHDLTLAWMDTLCINKDSSAELDESIQSMYAWYERAKVCIVYLASTRVLSQMHPDPWFSRGWTLQELLAPKTLKFYNFKWKQLAPWFENDKEDNRIIEHIMKKTSITREELQDIHTASLSRRMQLAASREVTREEDTAYSLMGIFNVSIATAYGEGAAWAFFCLLQEILSSTPDGVLDLLNWAGEPLYGTQRTTGALPTSPRNYLRRAMSISFDNIRPRKPLALTHMGMHIPVVLMPGVSAMIATDFGHETIGDYSATVTVQRSQWYPMTYRLLVRASDSDASVNKSPSHTTFAVFNIHEENNPGPGISIPHKCIAIPLRCSEGAGNVTSTGRFSRIDTVEPIVFNLEGKYIDTGDGADDSRIHIPTAELMTHGMQFISLYL